MQPSGEDMETPYSPSFNSYYNSNLAEVVARVTAEFAAAEDDEDGGDTGIGYENEDEDDFEFNLSNLVPAADDFCTVYPVFDRGLLREFDLVGEIESRSSDLEEKPTKAQIRLKNLFLEDRDGNPLSPSSSSSSDEADELEGIPPGSYCVWMLNKSPSASPSPGRCTKSNSTGSLTAAVVEKAKAWKLRDLLKRSRSDGKNQGRFMLLTPKKKADAPGGKGGICSVPTASAAGAGGKATRKTTAKTVAREGYFGGRSRETADKNKRRSYLPYRQDLVGFFVNPRALRKMHLPSF